MLKYDSIFIILGFVLDWKIFILPLVSCPNWFDNVLADGCKISKVTSSCDALFVLFNLHWNEEEVEGESEAAAAVAAVTLVFMRVVIVELLADFSTPPDTNDVLDDDRDIGCCCKR